MSILKLLASTSFLSVNKHLAKAVGLDAAVLFADLAGAQQYWDNEKGTSGEWFYRTREQIEQETTLSAKVQLRVMKVLIDKGLIKSKLLGMPAITHYQIGKEQISECLRLLSPKVETSNDQKSQHVQPKGSAIKNREIIIDNNKDFNSTNFGKLDSPLSDSENLSSKKELEKPKEKSSAKKEKVDVPYMQEFVEVLTHLTSRNKYEYRIPKQSNHVLGYGPYKYIVARLKEGYTVQELKDVINVKAKEWIGNPKMEKFVKYDTLFRASHFENYLNEAKKLKDAAQQSKESKIGLTVTNLSDVDNRAVYDEIMYYKSVLLNLRIDVTHTAELKNEELLDELLRLYNEYKKQKNG